MGWGSGSRLADDIWNIVEEYIPVEKKIRLCKEIIDVFEGMDCDTMCETGMYEFMKRNDDKFAVNILVEEWFEDDKELLESCQNIRETKKDAKILFDKIKQKLKEE